MQGCDRVLLPYVLTYRSNAHFTNGTDLLPIFPFQGKASTLQRKSPLKSLGHLLPPVRGWIVLPLVWLCICLVNPAYAGHLDNSSGKNSGMAEIVISDSDRGNGFAAHVGDVIAIRLAENSTTGYC